MDLLLILRDALASSLVGGLSLAIDARSAGQEVGVLFTQEALAAVARGAFEWPRELSGQPIRFALADRGKDGGLPVAGRGEGRRLDARAMLTRAREAGVELYACPTWSALLGLEGDPPAGLRALERAAVPRLVQEARKVVGTF